MDENKEKAVDIPAIELCNVTKTFGTTVAVNDVSFTIHKGEVVGFLGPNGSGKTTTMRLLTSYYTPDSGKILINGVDNQSNDINTRSRIGYLPENNPIYADMLVFEYLNWVAEMRNIPKNERKARIEEAVAETGIAEVYYRPLGQCSKGYKQRVGLAQAVLHHPEIFIMDEPTEGLDPNQRRPIRELIRSMGKGRTALLSTHVLQEVEGTCNRLLIIAKGRIVAQGTVEALRHQAKTKRYIDLEIEGEGVEDGLKGLANVDEVMDHGMAGGHHRYTLSILGDDDIRPLILELARKRGWTLWEIHEETTKLEDLFHSLTR